jgi:putative peptidoglycan binding protein
MKTKFYWFTLLASAALIAQAQGGGHPGGGGGGHSGFAGGGGRAGFAGGGGGHISSPGYMAGPSFHSVPHGNFGGGRFVAPGPRFSSIGARSPNSFRQQGMIGSNDAGRRLDGSRTFNRPGSRLTQSGNDSGRRFENRGSNFGRDHVFARRTADWHRDWDRRHDHWWNGHRCHFADGFWFIYDTGFYPYDYWYPYDYAYGSYPYEYDSGVYEGGADYYGQGAYDSSEQYADSTVAATQEQLARQGYYRGEIDGIFGPETRRAIMRYQSDHGLRVTGALTTDTLQALGLRRN